jgi:alkanesulfonate monooxygenase SsuD/methylene tetrahydromethanopterin reductase-like flavin-dependent oxidoreductase (luciferase family)
VSLAYIASATNTAEIAVGVLLAVLRHPVVVAKQMASVDRLTGGRVVLGVGAGWLAEDFEALAGPFALRGERLDEWTAVCRNCWTGRTKEYKGRHYRLPAGVLCYPTPSRAVPLLVGGISDRAIRRAALIGDGWIPLLRTSDDVVRVIGDGLRRAAASTEAAERHHSQWRCAYIRFPIVGCPYDCRVGCAGRHGRGCRC